MVESKAVRSIILGGLVGFTWVVMKHTGLIWGDISYFIKSFNKIMMLAQSLRV